MVSKELDSIWTGALAASRYHPVKTGHRRLAEAPTAAGVEGVVNWRLRMFLNLKSADIFSQILVYTADNT